MNRAAHFLRNTRAASAAEFALVLPLFLLLLLGTIDAGRFIWHVNQLEKATQVGARWAVATDIIPGGDAAAGLKNYSYAVSGGVTQGTVVPQASFPTFSCSGAAGGAVSCSCTGCPFTVAPGTVGQASFALLMEKISAQYGGIGPENVTLGYAWSGLGFAGDPNGPDVSPLVTVTISGVDFFPITGASMFGLELPTSSYSLTNEDGAGVTAYY